MYLNRTIQIERGYIWNDIRNFGRNFRVFTIMDIRQKKMNLYEDYRAGHVSREEYLIKKQKLSEQLVPLEAGIQKVEEGIRKYDEANIIFYSDFARLVDEFRNEEALSPELADAFIEKVLVDKNHNIEVVFKFQDEINMLCMRKAS